MTGIGCMGALLIVCYFFQDETDLSSDEDDDDSSSVLSKNTINKYFSAFRDMIGEEMVQKYNNQIGGENLTVEIDESMFGKR